jgi:hypothetical protein
MRILSVRVAWSFQWPRGHICFRSLCRDAADCFD